MALPNYLAKIKSAGVYRYVFDKTDIPEAQRDSIRLVVGYSEKGPFNTPVYIEDSTDFVRTYGNISRRMERKGIFFHRMALQALKAGPIVCLNLKPFNATDEPEKADLYAFNASDVKMSETEDIPEGLDNPGDVVVKGQNMHPVKAQALVAADESNQKGLTAIYNTNRFWKVDPERIHDITAMSGWSEQEGSEDYIRIVHTGSKDDSCTVFIRPIVPSNWNVKISDWYSSEAVDEMPAYLEPIKDHYLSEFFLEIYVFKGDLTQQGLYLPTGTLGSYKNPSNIWQPFCVPTSDDEDADIVTNPLYMNAYGEYADALDAMSDVTTSNFINRYVGICFPSFKDGNGNFIDIASVFNRDHQEHKMLLGMNEALLDEACDYDIDSDDSWDDDDPEGIGHTGAAGHNSFVHALCSAIVAGSHELDQAFESENPNNLVVFDPTCTMTKALYIKGYDYKSILRKDKGQSLQTKILNVLSYKGIREALTNNIDIDYKYLIDTFQTYPALAMKSQFSSIAKAKFDCLALLNFPPMVEVLNHCGWKDYKGGFDMKEILRKGDISLPSESQGASWSAFYTQLQMTDGAVKFTVPSAALVSNLFMTKRALRLPYYIVAGPNYGRITEPNVLGPDYNYARADLDILEPFGVNAIIHIPRQGIVINGNQTAKQTPITALSKVHVRELVTFLQDELEEMLLGYQWELNTATLRDMVRSKAEVILGLCQANGGIYDYKITCDESNNTIEVINNNMLVLDIDIIAARGTEKIVQTLTLHRIGTDLATV